MQSVYIRVVERFSKMSPAVSSAHPHIVGARKIELLCKKDMLLHISLAAGFIQRHNEVAERESGARGAYIYIYSPTILHIARVLRPPLPPLPLAAGARARLLSSPPDNI